VSAAIEKAEGEGASVTFSAPVALPPLFLSTNVFEAVVFASIVP
jgi:hypothetical protein